MLVFLLAPSMHPPSPLFFFFFLTEGKIWHLQPELQHSEVLGSGVGGGSGSVWQACKRLRLGRRA